MTLQDKKHWSDRSEAARDEVKDAVEHAFDWLVVRRREAAWAFGGAAVLALAAALFLYGRRARENQAWDKLAQAELLAYSGRPQEAEAAASQLAEAGGSPAAAALADMLRGDLLYPRGEFDKALAAYDRAAHEAPESLKPFALADKVMALESSGKSAECGAAAQAFLDAHADHMLAPQVLSSLSRCQTAAGQTDAAKAALQKLSLQFAGTPWAEWANARLQAAK